MPGGGAAPACASTIPGTPRLTQFLSSDEFRFGAPKLPARPLHEAHPGNSPLLPASPVADFQMRSPAGVVCLHRPPSSIARLCRAGLEHTPPTALQISSRFQGLYAISPHLSPLPPT